MKVIILGTVARQWALWSSLGFILGWTPISLCCSFILSSSCMRGLWQGFGATSTVLLTSTVLSRKHGYGWSPVQASACITALAHAWQPFRTFWKTVSGHSAVRGWYWPSSPSFHQHSLCQIHKPKQRKLGTLLGLLSYIYASHLSFTVVQTRWK